MAEPRKCEHCDKELELISGTLFGLPMYYMCPCKESQAAADAELYEAYGLMSGPVNATGSFTAADVAEMYAKLKCDPRKEVQEQIARTIPRLREKGPI